VQMYFRADDSRRPRTWAKTVRVRVPKKQTIGRGAVARMRDAKRAVLEAAKKGGK
jgi:hypothetical protein